MSIIQCQWHTFLSVALDMLTTFHCITGHSPNAQLSPECLMLRRRKHVPQVKGFLSSLRETGMRWRYPNCLGVIHYVSAVLRTLYREDSLLKWMPWKGESGPKPTCDPPVTPLDVSALIGVDGPLVASRENQYDASLAPVGSSWGKAGCFEDSQTFPTIAGTIPVYYDNQNLTVTQCTTFCGKSNKKVAAMMRRSGNWVSESRFDGLLRYLYLKLSLIV